MDPIQDLLQQLDEKTFEKLTLDELVKLDTDLRETFDKVRNSEFEGLGPKDIAVLKDLSDAAQSVRARAGVLRTEAEEAQASIDELAESIHAGEEKQEEKVEDPNPNGEQTEEETEEEEDDEAKAETPTPPQPDDVPEPEVEPEPEAKVTPLTALAAAAERRARRVSVKREAPTGRVGELSTMTFQMSDRDASVSDVANAIIEKRQSWGQNVKGDGDKFTVATMPLDIPGERYLDPASTTNDAKVDMVTASAQDPDAWTDAIVASGGWCAPLEANYDIEVIAEAHRPIRDSLPSFGAGRGGIRLRRGLGIASGAGAIDNWTNAIDQTPGSDTKNILTVSCDTIFETVLRAVTSRVQFGNFRGRADNEGVQAWLRVVAASHAREAEQQLLDEIDAGSTDLTASQQLGAARDLLVKITHMASGIRSRNRLRADARIRVMFPQWVPDMISADLTRGLQSDPSFLGVTSADISRWLAARNVNVTWYADELTSENPWQVFPTQPSGAVRDFPETVTWFAFPEGSWLFLDGGTLDLGVVRDSVLNGTNDYQLFMETFEAAAFRGVESFKIDSLVCVNGESSGGTDQNALCNS